MCTYATNFRLYRFNDYDNERLYRSLRRIISDMLVKVQVFFGKGPNMEIIDFYLLFYDQ